MQSCDIIGRRRNYHKRNYRQKTVCTDKTRMLSNKKETEFKYYLEQLFDNSKIDPDYVNNLTANILSKARMNSIQDTVEYLDEQVEKGHMSQELKEKIEKLLLRFSFRR